MATPTHSPSASYCATAAGWSDASATRRAAWVPSQSDKTCQVYVQYTCSANSAVFAARVRRIDDEGESDVLLEAGAIEPGDADGDREGGSA